MTDPPAGLDDVLDWALDEIARRVVERLREGDCGMVDQVASPLGRRRHCAMVRRLQASGDTRVAIVGRRHLATREAVEGELSRIGKQPSERSQESVDLLHELGLVATPRKGVQHEQRTINPMNFGHFTAKSLDSSDKVGQGPGPRSAH